MDLICFFRPNQSCRGISVLPDFGKNSVSAVNRFRPATSLPFGFPAIPFRRATKFSIKTHAKKKKNTSIVEPKPNKVEKLLFGEEEDEEEEEQVLLEDVLDGV